MLENKDRNFRRGHLAALNRLDCYGSREAFDLQPVPPDEAGKVGRYIAKPTGLLAVDDDLFHSDTSTIWDVVRAYRVARAKGKEAEAREMWKVWRRFEEGVYRARPFSFSRDLPTKLGLDLEVDEPDEGYVGDASDCTKEDPEIQGTISMPAWRGLHRANKFLSRKVGATVNLAVDVREAFERDERPQRILRNLVLKDWDDHKAASRKFVRWYKAFVWSKR